MFAKIPTLSKIPHIVPILPVYIIVLTVLSAFTKFVFLNYNPNTQQYEENFTSVISLLLKPIVIVLFYFCAIMTIITHTKAMFTHPGSISEEYINRFKHNPESYCKKCESPRPERARHCKRCNMCVLKFDHHCPWIANCVGIKNQKNFLQFLFFATLGDLVAFLCLLPKLLTIDLKLKTNSHNIGTILYLLSDKLFLLSATMFSIAMVISIGFLFTVQLGLVLDNVTTVETKLLDEGEKSKYYDNNRLNSFKIVMGMTWKEWLSPRVILNKVNNGYTYGKFNDLLSQGNENIINTNFDYDYDYDTCLNSNITDTNNSNNKCNFFTDKEEMGYAYDLSGENNNHILENNEHSTGFHSISGDIVMEDRKKSDDDNIHNQV